MTQLPRRMSPRRTSASPPAISVPILIPVPIRSHVFSGSRARRAEDSLAASREIPLAPPIVSTSPSTSACLPTSSPVDEVAFSRAREQISKDLPRTFPAHPLLDGVGRDALRRVLCAYARHNPSVGYCQGMNFIAALLLLLMEEEAAFWVLSSVCEDVVPGYFTNSMLASAVDQAVLQRLVEEKFPRVDAALRRGGAPIAAVAGSWFLTLYVNHLPWESALRVWDVLLFERTRAVLFQTALALVETNHKRLADAAEEDLVVEAAVEMAPGAFDGSALLAVAVAGFPDVTWDRIMHEYRACHRRMTREGARADDASGDRSPVPRGDKAPRVDARGAPSRRFRARRACRPRHGEAAEGATPREASRAARKEASRAARKEASRAARKEASRAARSRAARGTLTRTRTRTRTRTPKSTPSLSRTRPRPRRRSRLGVLRRRRRESRARGCFADAAGSTRGDVQVLLPKPHPHLARGCASLRATSRAATRVRTNAAWTPPRRATRRPRSPSLPVPPRRRPARGKNLRTCSVFSGYPPPRLRPRARRLRPRNRGHPPKRPNLPPRRRCARPSGAARGASRDSSGFAPARVPVPATRRWRR